MQEPFSPAIKKTYEISYALLRLAAVLESRGFADAIEKSALKLLESVVSGSSESEYQSGVSAIRYVLLLGKDVGKIHPDNADFLVRQLESLGSLIIQKDPGESTAGPARVELEEIFSTEVKSRSKNKSKSGNQESGNKNYSNVDTLPNSSKNGKASISHSERQLAILNKIRQSGDCRTKDLQAVLPDVSERTLRYDLQKLIENGKVERFGNGGPDSWYRIGPEHVEHGNGVQP